MTPELVVDKIESCYVMSVAHYTETTGCGSNIALCSHNILHSKGDTSRSILDHVVLCSKVPGCSLYCGTYVHQMRTLPHVLGINQN